MRCFKKSLRLFLPVVAWIAITAWFPDIVQAGIAFSGNVSPASSDDWNSSTHGYVGNTAAGAVVVDSDDNLASMDAYLGYSSGVTGAGTVTGADSTWSATRGMMGGGRFYVGYAGNGMLDIQNNGAVSCEEGATIGYSAGSNGTVTVDGTGSTFANVYSMMGMNMWKALTVGSEGNGTLNILNGAVRNGSAFVGQANSGGGEVTVTGSNSTWTNNGTLYVGYQGSGMVNIAHGGTVSSNSGYIGRVSSSDGEVTVEGSGSTWSNTSDLYVGNEGYGVLNIYNGSVVNNASGTTYVRREPTAVGSKIDFGASGGTLTTKTLYTAATDLKGTGTIVTHGLVGDSFNLTFDAGPTKTFTLSGSGQNLSMTVDMSDSDNVGDLGAGYRSAGSITISNASEVYTTKGYLGFQYNSSGTATVTGAGSAWNISSDFYIGYNGNGTLKIENGASVNNAGDARINSGVDSSSTATVEGNNSTWNIGSNLYVGYLGTATLNIDSGAAITTANTTFVGYSSGSGNAHFGAGGTLTTKVIYTAATDVTGTGSIKTRGLVLDGNLTFDSPGLVQTHTLNDNVAVTLDMSGVSGAVSDVGAGYRGDGSLTISNAVTINSARAYLGYEYGASGTATVIGAGSTWNCGTDFYVGHYGDGTLKIQNGGTVSDVNGYIGSSMGAMGAATVDGNNSSWTNSGDLYVGGSAMTTGDQGTLSITRGGAVSNTNGYIMGSPMGSSMATVNGNGSTWTNSGDLYIGYGYSGGEVMFDITAGGTVTNASGYVGNISYASGIVTVDGAGSTWINTSGAIHGGNDDNAVGTINITNGGTVFANSIQGGQGGFFGGTGTMTVNFNGGTLKANQADNTDWITLTNGGVFIQDGGAVFDTNGFNMGIGTVLATGNTTTDGGMTKLGDGTLTLSAANAYTGVTTVKAGVLALVGTDITTPVAWNPVLNLGGADIQGGKLVFDYTGGTSPAATVAQIMDDSFGTSNPFSPGNGAHIYSSTAQAAGMALGWADNGTDAVTIMYTLYGDSNLDGSVNGTDLNAVLSYYNQSGEVWNHGDFNYDGSVNGTDLNTVLSNYNQSLSSSTAAVPEPSTLLLIVLGLLSFLAWRKKKSIPHTLCAESDV